MERASCSPIFLPKMRAPLGWSCRLDSPIARRAGPPRHRCFPSRRPADCHQMPPTGWQRPPDPASSPFKQNPRTQLRWRKGPAGDPSSYPIPNARGARPPRPATSRSPKRPRTPRTLGRLRPPGREPALYSEELQPQPQRQRQPRRPGPADPNQSRRGEPEPPPGCVARPLAAGCFPHRRS